MKKFISMCFLLLLFASVSAQQTPSTIAMPELWQKSRSQRTAGFVLLGSGLVVGTIGFATGVNNVLVDVITGRETVKGTGAMIAGVSLMAASIPFFILAGKNKRRSLAVTGLPFLPQANNRALTYDPAAQVQIKLTQIIL
jgi:hypothetical protein